MRIKYSIHVSILILIEVMSIFFIGYLVYKKLSNRTFTNTISVSPMDRKNLLFPIDTPLAYYYELAPNTKKEDDFSYMRRTGIVIHTINADGLNERKDYEINKPLRTYRIVTLGDSFTEGAFVETKDNYSKLLEDMLNANMHCNNYSQFEVINLGVAGYDMQYNLERFKRKGQKYSPDLVILWTDENDYINNNEKYYALVHTWDPNKEAPAIVAGYRAEGDFAPEANAVWYKFNTLYDRKTLILEELSYLRELMRLYTGPMIIFSLDQIPVDIRQPIQTMSMERGNTYFFPSIPSTYDKFPDNHPSIRGHQQFAEFLFSNVLSHAIIPCNKK